VAVAEPETASQQEVAEVEPVAENEPTSEQPHSDETGPSGEDVPETGDELADAAGATPEATEAIQDSTPPVTAPAETDPEEPAVSPEAEVAPPAEVPAGIPVEPAAAEEEER
jgi:hypothetical protein